MKIILRMKVLKISYKNLGQNIVIHNFDFSIFCYKDNKIIYQVYLFHILFLFFFCLLICGAHFLCSLCRLVVGFICKKNLLLFRDGWSLSVFREFSFFMFVYMYFIECCVCVFPLFCAVLHGLGRWRNFRKRTFFEK